MRCVSCKYDLQKISRGDEHRCPECGRVFDPRNPMTFDPRGPVVLSEAVVRSLESGMRMALVYTGVVLLLALVFLLITALR